ncbi:hypothetical protein [Salinispira pacifica]
MSTRTVGSLSMALIVLAFFLLGIGGTMLFNLWSTENSKVPVTIGSGEFAGQADPADIRGSYSFKEIETAFGVPVGDLAAAFGVDKNAEEFRCKDLETEYEGIDLGGGEIGTDSVRLFVALYNGIPYEAEETTRLPVAAAAVLDPRIADEKRREVEKLYVDLPGAPATPPTTDGAASDVKTPVGDYSPEERQVTGQTTFYDLGAWGLSAAEIRTALEGKEPGASNIPIRDYCQNNELSFSTVKGVLQKLVDGKK